MSATQTGIYNAQLFLSSVYTMGDSDQQAQVQGLLKANNWQGVVDYAGSFQYFNFGKNPFTASDVDVGLNPWMFVAIPEDYNDDVIKGAAIAMRPYTGVGFCIPRQGGVAINTSGKLLRTNSASVDAGAPTGSPLTIPEQDGTKSAWILSQTTTGCLAFFKDAKPYLVLVNAQQVWTLQYDDLKDPPFERSNGNLIPTGSGDTAVGTDVVTKFVDYAAQSWSVAGTDLGNLVFRSQLNSANAPVMVCLSDSGWLCNGASQRYDSDDMSISLQGYFDYFWQQFLLAGDEALDWVADIATTSWEWMDDAAMDAWDWIEDTGSAAWAGVEDAWDDVEEGIDDIADEITDPDTWNPSKW